MSLISLALRNIRLYERIHLEPSPHLNLFSGANASGKTTLLEAIHLLGTGRSFRTAQTEQLRKNGSNDLSVTGNLVKADGETTRLGLSLGIDGRRASINGLETKQVSNLARHLPLQVISPDTHYEYQQSAKHRRGILDWGLFHVEPDFPDLWTRYQRILQQRNAALKGRGQNKARHVWDDELVEYGEKLQAARHLQTERLLPYYRHCCHALLGEQHEIDLALGPGWDGQKGFGDSLYRDRERDTARGFTHSGPHRADLLIVLNGQVSKLSASHGQLKLLVVALRLAQIRYLLESSGSGSGKGCCLLIDDLAAELDVVHRARLTRYLASLTTQVFVTTTESSLIDREYWPSYKTFHVEHGIVTN